MASTDLKKYQTKELANELKTREGVQCLLIDPHVSLHHKNVPEPD
ncbi:MAG: BC1881 family protein [Firmicutes bacterium]|nr:BC1881 family protein [Bacillota bacterium]